MTDGEDEIQFQENEDDEDMPLEMEARSIFTEKKDREVEALHGKFVKGRLILQPDFQRKFVWDKGKASRLIESAILDIPLPVVYLSEETDGKEYVIDGQQRLTAFFSFIDDKFPDGSNFRLSGLKVLSDLNKKAFRDLNDDQQDKVRGCAIRTITFKRESDPNLKFEIFERLNTGSVSLNDQELRNCIYRGRYNAVLKELSEDSNFRFILDLQSPEKRMRDLELVLRFAAFFHQTYLNYKPPIRVFLNVEMAAFRQVTQEKEDELRKAFMNATYLLRTVLGKNAFRRYYTGNAQDHNGYWEDKQLNTSLYDILMWSFARLDKNNAVRNADAIREALINLMTTDQQFIDSIEKSTSSKTAVNIRFDRWRQALENVIDVNHREERCFSRALKEKLFEVNPTCTICGNRINDVDDSAIDHIEQYWCGGRTIPENARLVHRYCNSSRPRNDIVSK